MAALRVKANYLLLPPGLEAGLPLRRRGGLTREVAAPAHKHVPASRWGPHEKSCQLRITSHTGWPIKRLQPNRRVAPSYSGHRNVGASCSASLRPSPCSPSTKNWNSAEDVQAAEARVCQDSGLQEGQEQATEGAVTAVGSEDEMRLESRPLMLQSIALLNVGLLPLQAFEQSGLPHDLSMMALGILGAFTWVRIFDELARQNILDQKLSRKLVHITTGLLYMFLWPLFSAAPGARVFAAAVPFVNISKLLLLGLGIVKDEGAVRAISREGDPRELLGGPMYYVLAFTLLILCFWRTSPTGVVALALMCGGDGIADIVGRRYGSAKLPWNEKKSWAGSLAMFCFGFPLALGFTYFFCSLGFYECEFWSTATRVAIITLASTVAESIPSEKLDDNLTVPFTAAVVGSLLFPSSLSWLAL